MAQIFIQIASYRDTELIPTVEDALNKASRPYDLVFGICWQGKIGIDSLPLERLRRGKALIVDADLSKGTCWARAQTQKLWDGEPYTLQIDSHTRFVPGWDDLLLFLLHQCPSPKPLLTAYPAAYTPGAPVEDGEPWDLIASHFTEAGILGLRTGRTLRAEEKPIRGKFIAAGFLFARSELISEVPYDPDIYFQGEEIAIAVRAWTRGWDFFHPNHVALYHYYGRPEAHKHWADHQDWGELEKRSVVKLNALLRGEVSGKFGLGDIRTIEDYQTMTGVNFQSKTIQD